MVQAWDKQQIYPLSNVHHNLPRTHIIGTNANYIHANTQRRTHKQTHTHRNTQTQTYTGTDKRITVTIEVTIITITKTSGIELK